MLGLTHQNFLSAATGIVTPVALIRGLARASNEDDRPISGSTSPAATLYILLPICIVYYDLPGSPQACRKRSAPMSTTTLEGAEADDCSRSGCLTGLPIKMLGTNCRGGFFKRQCVHILSQKTRLLCRTSCR